MSTTRGRQQRDVSRLRQAGKTRWAPVAAALLLAVVALVAFGGTSSATAASAAARTTHTTKKTPTPTKPAFALSFSCAQGLIFGTTTSALVCVHTVPGATLAITVKACGKLVRDPGLSGTGPANTSGDYSWSYSPPSTCKTNQATVKATSGGKSVTQKSTFTLQELSAPQVPPVPTTPAVPTV